MSLGSKSDLINNALVQVLGEGFTSHCTTIPKGVPLPDTIRHYDATGVVLPRREDLVVPVSNGYCEATVGISVYRCNSCGNTKYRVTAMQYLLEYEPTVAGQTAISKGIIPLNN